MKQSVWLISFIKKLAKKKLNNIFVSTLARKSKDKTNKPLTIIRGLFSGKFKTNTETKYAKILSFALNKNWTVFELSQQLSEKGIAKLHQQYLEQKEITPVARLKGFNRRKTYSVTEFKDAKENFIVLFGKTTATSVKFYKGSTNPRIVKMLMRELGLLERKTKKK